MKQVKLIKTKVTNTALNKQQPDFELDYKTEFLRLVEIMPDGITTSQMGAADSGGTGFKVLRIPN